MNAPFVGVRRVWSNGVLVWAAADDSIWSSGKPPADPGAGLEAFRYPPTRLDIAHAAREWLDTPYRHQHRAKGAAVDCAGLVIGVARELGLVAPDFDVTAYSARPDGRSLLEHCDRWMQRIPRDQMEPGDVLVIRWAKDPQHIGFVGDYVHGGLSLIHAYSDGSSGGKVIEHHLGPAHLARFVMAYRIPGTQ